MSMVMVIESRAGGRARCGGPQGGSLATHGCRVTPGWVSLFLEDKFDEGGVEVVSDVLVLLLFSHKLVCEVSTKLHVYTLRVLSL